MHASPSRGPALLCAALLPICILASPASAQLGSTPTVTIETAFRTERTSSASVTVRVTNAAGWDEPVGQVQYPGGGIGSVALSRSSGDFTSGAWVGAVNLQPGQNVFTARVCQFGENCVTASAAYSYVVNQAPTVSVSPASTTVRSAGLSVTVGWSDDFGLDHASRSLVHNDGVMDYTVTNAFSYQGTSNTARTSQGTLTLRSGTNTLTARIRDSDGIWTTRTETYTYTPNVAPVAAIQTASGTFRNQSLHVVVNWTDEYGLDHTATARRLLHNNASVVGAFSYDGTSNTARTSQGTLTLAPGSNTFTAQIRDVDGAWSNVASATYTHTVNQAPVAAIQTASGSFRNPSLPVVVNWTDEYGLDHTASARRLLHNNASIVGAFSYEGTSNTARTSQGTLTLAPGSNTFTAQIRDVDGAWSNVASASFTYTPNQAPVATIQTASGTFSNAALTVTVSWSDEYGLDHAASARRLLHNNASVVGAFSYVGTSNTARTSQGTLTLVPGSNTFTAQIRDVDGAWSNVASASYTLDSGGTAELAPSVSIADVNPGTTIDRSGCVRASIGAGAEYECGELRLGHALPETRTLNRTRAPMLTYNTAHAWLRTRVQADVGLPAGAAVPDSVSLSLRMHNGTSFVHRATRTWAGSDWTSGAVRRVTTHAGTTWGTGLYPYTVEVSSWYQGRRYSTIVADTMVVVNRTASPFHAGWWLSGLEELHVASMLWVGGDGSTRRYRPAGTNVWKTDAYTRPDSITRDGSGMYHRHLSDGSRVVFDAMGRHVQTVNRLGQVTEFEYRAAGSRVLRYLRLPTASGARPVYEFHYTADSLLWKVTAPPLASQARETTIGYNTATRRLTITDPDLRSVHFDYHSTAWLIERRTDRREVLTRYRYAYGAMLDARIYMAGSAASSSDIVTAFAPAEVRGFNGTPAVDPAAAYTRIDGPRAGAADTTLIWVNRWGAPTRIRDMLGSETQIFRQHATFPGLVTRTIAPNGYDQRAGYDSRGRLTRTIGINSLDDGRNDTTTYTYGNAAWPYFVTRVRAPEGELTHFFYDDATGNRLWERVGSDVARRVNYFYNAAGQVDSVRMPPVSGGTVRPVERYGYDVRGNLTSVTTPTGIVTRYHADAIGRDTLIVSPTSVGVLTEERRERIVYDVMGRVLTSTTSAPRHDPTRQRSGIPSVNETESVTVIHTYDAEGNPTQVDRQLSPNPANLTRLWTKWDYDRAGRVTRIEHPDLTVETFVHEGNGQSLRHRPRGCGASTCEIVTRYDVLGRDSVRVVPHRDFSGSDWVSTYRLDPNTSLPANRIAADTSRFTYDAMGNLRTADNREARIRRNYYRGGLLHTDSTWIRDYGSAAFNQVYGQRMVYDRNERRRDLYYPAATGPGASPRAQYDYHPETGLLSTLVDLGGNAFGYEHDAQGNTHKVFMPGGLVDTRILDLESRLTSRSVSGYRTVGYQYQYTEAGQLAGLAALGSPPFEGQYTGLGSVVRTEGVTHEFQAPYPVSIYPNDISVDPLGNVVYSPVHSSPDVIVAYPTETWTSYSPSGAVTTVVTGDTIVTSAGQVGTGLSKEFRISATGWFMADGSGNQALSSRETVREWWSQDVTQMTPLRTVQETTRSYYGWDGKLRVVDQTKRYCHAWGGCESFEFGDGILDEPPAVFEEYRYDALGRRIMVRGRPDPRCTLAGCEAYLDTYVWDDAQILSEFREGSAGGRVTYTHGPGIDAPVSLWRSGTTMVLHANRGGLIDMATYTNGTRVDPMPYTWAGLQSPLYPRYASHARGTQWLGSLVANKHDGSGLVYMRNRYLNPQTGQFTQTDPIGLAGGLNLYGYASGDPINFNDPFGLCGPLTVVCVAAAAAARGGAHVAARAAPATAVTVASSRVLGRALQAEGHGRRSLHAAHHIVAGGAKRNADAVAARQRLAEFGIDINSTANGVFLPNSRVAAAASRAAYHRNLHTNAYYRAVRQELDRASNQQEAVAVLNSIRDRLLNNTFPR